MYCVQCGTQNTAKATTCSQCGAALRPAPGPGTPEGRRCPMCSTVNAADAVYCVQCGARVQLLADADIPMPRSSFDDDYARDTNWFDPPSPPAGGSAPGGREGGRGDQGSASSASEPPAAGGGWLGSLRGEETNPPASPSPATGGGWLSSLRGGDEDTTPPPTPSPAVPMPPPPPASTGGGGSWLDSLRDASVSEAPDEDELPANEESTLPAWLRGTAPAPPPAPAAPAEPALPAWLSDNLSAAPRSNESESPPPAPSLPAWLADEPTSLAPLSAAPAPELPAWLAGLRTSVDEEAEEEAAPELAAGDTSGVPAWLQDLHAAGNTPPPVAPPPAPPAADLPPWLRDLTPPAAPEAAPAPTPTADAIPPWLAGLTEEPAAPPPAPAPEQPESTPWWAGLSGTDAEASAEQTPSPANVNLTDQIELPAWLQAAALAPPPAPVPVVGGGGAEAESPAPVDAEVAPAASLPAEAEDGLILPSWMEDAPAAAAVPAEPPGAEEPILVATVVPAEPPGTGEPVPVAAAVPAQPLDTEEPVPASTDAPATAPAEPPPGPEAAPVPTEPLRPRPGGGSGILFPAWLNDLSTAPDADATAAAVPGESQLVGEEDLPAWLRALQPETPPPPTPAPVPPIVPMPAPAFAAEQLPEWLQALSVSTPVEEEAPAEAATTLAEALRTTTPTRVVRARPPRAGAVETFTRLLNPPAPVVTPRRAPTRQERVMAWLFPDRLIYTLLLLTVIAMWAILRSPTIAPNPALTAPTDEARAFHALIAPTGVITPGRSGGSAGGLAAPLPLGRVAQQPVTGTITGTAVLSPALVVFDWDASRYGEMHELSRAVTRDLVSSGRPFASVSLLPQGPGFADQVVNEVGSDPEFHTDLLNLPSAGGLYGSRYVNLGWRPGNEAAIHALVSDPNGVLNTRGTALNYDYRYQRLLDRYPLTQKAPALSQYGVVILLVSDESNLRLWMEQLASQTTVPVIAAVPASLRAGVAPYLDPALAGLTTARLRGAVFGVQGASQLEQLRLGPRLISSAEQIRQGRWLHTESVALLVIAALLLLGFFAGIYRWANRTR